MYSEIICKYHYFVLIISVTYLATTSVQGFNIGVRGTTCSLDPSDHQNACQSLYDAECDGKHCKCPSGTHEDKTVKKCLSGAAPGRKASHDDFGDLPFDYVPGKKPEVKPEPKAPAQPAPGQPALPPAQPQPPPVRPVPAQPQAPVEDPHLGEKAGGGIGGGIGLMVLVGLVYFCCCRGEKGQNLRSKLPFFKGRESQPGANYQMQQPPPGQYPNSSSPTAE